MWCKELLRNVPRNSKTNEKLEKMENIKTEVISIIKKIYNKNEYPAEMDLVLEKKNIDVLLQNLTRCLSTNVEFKDCHECEYNYSIAISDSKDVPIIPDYMKGCGKRSAWIKKFGKDHYQMYLSMSRLGRYAMFYWTKYSYFLFERSKERYQYPHNGWRPIIATLTDTLSELNIKLIPPLLLRETLDIDYDGKIEGLDKHPSILKLLFGEELH